MECPNCAGTSKVLETRQVPSGLRRRRECHQCRTRFTTVEAVDRDLLVRKRDGRVEPFNSAKLARSIVRSAHVVSMNVNDVNGIVERIERSLLSERIVGPVDSALIGDRVLKQLHGVSPAADLARIHFAMVFLGRSDIPGALRSAEGFLRWLSENYLSDQPGTDTVEYKPGPRLVLKRDGRRLEPFDEPKLQLSIAVAMQDRARPRDLRVAVDGILSEVLDTFSQELVVSSLQLGAEILRHLRLFDGLAYLRYSATFKRLYTPDLIALDAKSVLAVEFKGIAHPSQVHGSHEQ
jgi:transcriptional repressor NrdR